MKKLLLALLIVIVTCTITLAKDKVDRYEQYIRQVIQQIDCQEVKIDQRDMKGKLSYKKICFYDVIIGSEKRHVTMWQEVNGPGYGFISSETVMN